jgi:uncharacterized protein YhhL (DUF1145 family)
MIWLASVYVLGVILFALTNRRHRFKVALGWPVVVLLGIALFMIVAARAVQNS